MTRGAVSGAGAAVRGGGFVMGWFALVAVLVVACSKEQPAPTPNPTPTPIVSAGPSVPGSSPSNAIWASESASASAVASATASATASAPAAASANVPVTATIAPKTGPKEFACGGGDKPKCPLQNWMNTTMKPAMSSADPAKVAGHLRKIAGMAPSGYPAWAKIANDGAAEVESKKDVAAAKPSCTKCHEQYKAKWKAEDRDHAI